jgi:carbohydrate diacid regulator
MADIKHKPLDERDFCIILTLAKNNMRATETSYDLDVHRGTVMYRIEKIKKLTGLDPMNFYDLHELVKMAKGAT